METILNNLVNKGASEMRRFWIAIPLVLATIFTPFLGALSSAHAAVISITLVQESPSNFYRLNIVVDDANEDVICDVSFVPDNQSLVIGPFHLDMNVSSGFGIQASVGGFSFTAVCDNVSFTGYIPSQIPAAFTVVNMTVIRHTPVPSATPSVTVPVQPAVTLSGPIPVCDFGTVFVFWDEGEGVAVYRGIEPNVAEQVIGTWVDVNAEPPAENELLQSSTDASIRAYLLTTGEVQINYTDEDGENVCVINPITRVAYNPATQR